MGMLLAASKMCPQEDGTYEEGMVWLVCEAALFSTPEHPELCVRVS